MPNYSSRYGQSARGAISGGTAGFAVGGPVGAAVGAGIGLASGLFSKSPEEERQQRYQDYLAQREEVRKNISAGYDTSLQKGSENIGRLTSGLTSRFKNSAASRAAAMGRVNDTEAFQAPVVGQVANAGSNAMSNLTYNLGEEKNRALMNFDNQTLNANADYADRPIEPNMSDYVQELSPLVTQAAQYGQLNSGTQTAPTLSASPGRVVPNTNVVSGSTEYYQNGINPNPPPMVNNNPVNDGMHPNQYIDATNPMVNPNSSYSTSARNPSYYTRRKQTYGSLR